MKTVRARLLAVAIGAVVAITAAGSAAIADDDDAHRDNNIRVQLSGYQEDPGVISTTGNGVYRAHIDVDAQEITYSLSYSDLMGNVAQAHIHIGGRAQSGGISIFLCTNLGNGPVGTQLCPAAPATISGTIRPADVIGPVGQGVAAGEFGEVIAALRLGLTYVNVHSSQFPAGEIRAQITHRH